MNDVRSYLITAVVVILFCSGLRALIAEDTTQRNYRFMPDMVTSATVESFDAGPGGTVMQHLVSGVVARDHMPLRFGLGPEEAQRAGREMPNPITEPDFADYDAGKRLYGIYCTVCHDAGGNGQGPVIARGFLPPPSLHGVRAMAIADGEMFHLLTFGQGNMASYASQLSREERWQVILYVRRLQEGN